MDRMSDSGSDDGGSSPLVVTNKTEIQKKKKKFTFNFLFLDFCFSMRSFGGKAQQSSRKESLLSIFFFWIFVFQSGALEERRSSHEKKIYFQFSLFGFFILNCSFG
jgi:hypothetical protein